MQPGDHTPNYTSLTDVTLAIAILGFGVFMRSTMPRRAFTGSMG